MAKENSESGWYNPKDQMVESTDQGSDQKNNKPQEAVTWTASEFISNHKGSKWNVTFFGLLLALIALIYIFTKDLVSVVALGIIGVLFLILANRKPRQLTYEINNQGIIIGDKIHPYNSFRSFSFSSEGAVTSINFIPLKRFMPEVSIFFPPDQEDKIVEILVEHLPHDEHSEHVIDKVSKYFRF